MGNFDDRYPLLPVCTQPPFLPEYQRRNITEPGERLKPRYRCNSCGLEFYKHKYKAQLLVLHEGGWTTLYLRGLEATPDQGRLEYEGRPIKFLVSYAKTGHTFDADCGGRDRSLNYECGSTLDDCWDYHFEEDTTGYGDQP